MLEKKLDIENYVLAVLERVSGAGPHQRGQKQDIRKKVYVIDVVLSQSL